MNRRMLEQPIESDCGEIIDEYRINRIVVVVAWIATVIFGLIWVFMMVIGGGISLQGEGDFFGILCGGLPITVLFGASVYATFRIQRSLVRIGEEGFVYREGKQYHAARYSQVSSAEVISEQRRRRRLEGDQYITIHWLRVRLNDDARTEIRIQPLLMHDRERLSRWREFMQPNG